MARTTSDDVRRVYENLIDRMNEMGMDTEHAYLNVWAPASRGTRFTVGNLPGGIGSFHTIGARNAYDAIAFASSVLYAAQKHARAES